MHLTDLDVGFLCSTPIVAGSIPVGVGAAFAEKLKGNSTRVVIYFGEGATEEGVFAEALNFAALKSLPVLFVCENNLYSVYSPLDVRQCPQRDRAKIASAHHIPTKLADGNDVIDVSKTVEWGLSEMQRKQGPVFLEFNTYRFREHCGPNYDNHIGYRTEEEYLHHLRDCPIEKYRSQITDVELMQQKIESEIAEAIDFAKRSSPPEFDPLAEALYAENL